jgi:hypothetical protein
VRSAGEPEYSGLVWAIDGSQGVSAPLPSAACINKNENHSPGLKIGDRWLGGRGLRKLRFSARSPDRPVDQDAFAGLSGMTLLPAI